MNNDNIDDGSVFAGTITDQFVAKNRKHELQVLFTVLMNAQLAAEPGQHDRQTPVTAFERDVVVTLASDDQKLKIGIGHLERLGFDDSDVARLHPDHPQYASMVGKPVRDELDQSADIIHAFGSIGRAYALIRRVTGDEGWESVRRRKAEDLLVYLALGRFRRRPPFSKLPLVLRRDIRAFFGTYSKACRLADDLLFRAGNADAINDACQSSAIGKLLPNALYLHRSAMDYLSPLLRVYEGCARAYIGDLPDATVVKLHRFSGKVSYLVYPKFERDPHPALVRGVKVALRSRDVSCYEYTDSNNPPILHRKETMLHEEHPLYPRFARLTSQEERAGLLDDSASIGTREGWAMRLRERGFHVRGHRLLKQKVHEAAMDRRSRE